MTAAEETVSAFLAECGKGKSAMMEAFRTYFTPETVWELIGFSRTVGADEAVAVMEAVQESHGMDCMVVETLAIATQGNKVLTERIDNVCKADGEYLMSTPTMGIFEVEGGKIIAWRDYYDTATYH